MFTVPAFLEGVDTSLTPNDERCWYLTQMVEKVKKGDKEALEQLKETILYELQSGSPTHICAMAEGLQSGILDDSIEQMVPSKVA
jgi:hypothetical protein